MRSRILIGLLSIVSATLLLESCSKLGGGGDGEDDGNSPFAITDLKVTAVSDSSITMKWTATGDDSSAGTASSYDIRMAREFISNDIWETATQLSGEPAPSLAGQTDSMTVSGLMRDSTYYFAIVACDEANNCSWRSNCVQGTCFTDFVITFPDTGLEAAVRRQINKPSGDLNRSDVITMTFLEANSCGIQSLSGLEYCINMQGILLNGNPQLSDIGPLSGLRKLTDLQFTGDNITDLSPLENLVNLQTLFMSENSQLSNLGPIAGLTRLTVVLFGGDNITDITPLAGLTNLEIILLNDNPGLSDISPLAGLRQLRTIQFTADNISDISALDSLTNLTGFSFRTNPLVDISALSHLPNLHWMELSQTLVTDLSPLVANSGIAALDTIYLYEDSHLSQQSINEYIPTLVSRGVTVLR